MPSDFRAVIRYMQKGECPVDRLVSMVVCPQEAEDAMNRWAEAPGKVFRILVKF
jgi:threonine dehydrogenase-like Zn-dependent dehydrogenase